MDWESGNPKTDTGLCTTLGTKATPPVAGASQPSCRARGTRIPRPLQIFTHSERSPAPLPMWGGSTAEVGDVESLALQPYNFTVSHFSFPCAHVLVLLRHCSFRSHVMDLTLRAARLGSPSGTWHRRMIKGARPPATSESSSLCGHSSSFICHLSLIPRLPRGYFLFSPSQRP